MFASSPELFAGCRVFRRLSMPRHPPYTLKSLATFIDHRQLQMSEVRSQRSEDLRPLTTFTWLPSLLNLPHRGLVSAKDSSKGLPGRALMNLKFDFSNLRSTSAIANVPIRQKGARRYLPACDRTSQISNLKSQIQNLRYASQTRRKYQKATARSL